MKKWHWIGLVLLAVATSVVDVIEFIHAHNAAAHGEAHASHWWSFPGFWILFGGIGCAVLILFGKKLLGPIVYKKEDYYNE